MNQVAKFDAYPMPRVEEVFEGMGTASVVSTLDLAKGYWQIPLTPESREKTAFTTPFGLFEFEVMPFSLHNAAATFQRTMNHVLRTDVRGLLKRTLMTLSCSATTGRNTCDTFRRCLINFDRLA